MRVTNEHGLKNWLQMAGALGAAAVLAGCASGSVPGGVAQMPLSASAVVRVCDTAKPSCSGSTNFSLGQIRDLSVAAAWENLAPGTHTQQIDILLPNGGLYQTFSSAFLVPEATVKQQEVVQQIPVVGTWITQRAMTGNWSMRISLDGRNIVTETISLQP